MCCLRERIWKGDASVADVEELENFGRVRKLCSEPRCRGGSHADAKEKNSCSLSQTVQSSLQEDQVFPDIRFKSGSPITRKKSTTMVFEKKRTGLNRQTDKRMTPKLEVISGGCVGTIFIVITFQPRGKLYVPNEESFSTPFTHVDVVRWTPNTRNIPHACTLEKHESAGKSIFKKKKKIMKISLLRKGINSLSHYNLVHKVFPIPEAMQIPDAKAAVDKG